MLDKEWESRHYFFGHGTTAGGDTSHSLGEQIKLVGEHNQTRLGLVKSFLCLFEFFPGNPQLIAHSQLLDSEVLVAGGFMGLG